MYNDICAPFLCWIHAGLLLWCRCNAAWKRWLGSIAESKSCKCADKWEFLGLCVCVLSGLVQGYKIFSMGGLDRLPKDMMKRYFRLSLPVFFISLIVYLMIKGEMFYNVQANQIVQSPWLGTYYLEKKTLKDVFYTSFISVWFVVDSTFSNAFWMLKEIFVGSYLTYILSMIGYKKRKNVLVIYAGLGIVFWILQSYMLAFVAGVIIAYIIANTEKIKVSANHWRPGNTCRLLFGWISNRGSTNKYLSFV